MPHGINESIDTTTTDKKKTKRHLARQLIQHIMTLYDSIIQKIEHGIGILWEEYFSQELFNIAKLRVEHQLINDINELNDWFQKISANIRDKVTNLSANLLSHFDEIIRGQVDFLNNSAVEKLTFDKENELQQKYLQKFDDPLSQNKLNHSLYETCTQSSRGQKKKRTHQRLQTVSSQSICSQDMSKQLIQEQNFELDTNKNQTQQILPQLQTNKNLEISHRKKNQTPKRLRKISQDDSDYEQQAQGGFYGVFLGILEAFDM